MPAYPNVIIAAADLLVPGRGPRCEKSHDCCLHARIFSCRSRSTDAKQEKAINSRGVGMVNAQLARLTKNADSTMHRFIIKIPWWFCITNTRLIFRSAVAPTNFPMNIRQANIEVSTKQTCCWVKSSYIHVCAWHRCSSFLDACVNIAVAFHTSLQ